MRRYLRIMPLMLLLVCARPARAGFISEVLSNNPNGFWILNDAPGSPATATDSSGNNFDGTYGPGVLPQGIAGPSWVPGDGLVADFDGGQISFSAPLDLGGSGFTIAAWVDPTLASLTQTTRFVASGTGFNGYGFGTAPGGGLIFTSFTQEDYFTTSLRLQANVWQYVTVVLDASADANFYLNGVLVETDPGSASTPLATGNFTIGNQSPGFGHTDEIYTGGLAGISEYDTQLTSADIQNQFDAAQSGVPEPGTAVLIVLALALGSACFIGLPKIFPVR